MVRTVTATRYVTPLREGGSLPALVEADDDGLYVVKLRGAGQGPRALVAELLAGEIGRLLDLPGARDRARRARPGAGEGRARPGDPAPDRASGGLNVGLDFLPGALPFAPAIGPIPTPELAADVVWFDALVTNLDRTPHNPNLLVWHGAPWLIDHGAALYIHHTWRDPGAHARRPFPRIRDHVLLPFAASIVEADARLAPRVDRDALARRGRAASRTTGCRTTRPRRPGRPAAGLRRLPASPAPGAAAVPERGAYRCRRVARFEYAIVRVVPRVERGERMNAGIDPARPAAALPRRADGARRGAAARAGARLRSRPRCGRTSRRSSGSPAGDAVAGPIARLGQAERFHWLVAPSSTIIQPSEVHTGLTDDPAAELEALFEALVRVPGARA